MPVSTCSKRIAPMCGWCGSAGSCSTATRVWLKRTGQMLASLSSSRDDALHHRCAHLGIRVVVDAEFAQQGRRFATSVLFDFRRCVPMSRVRNRACLNEWRKLGSAVRATACKAPRQPWHQRQSWQRGICNLQNPRDPVGFEDFLEWKRCYRTALSIAEVSVLLKEAIRPARSGERNWGMAGSTGLEPAASAVTGQRSNQLNYDPNATHAISELVIW